MVRPIRTIHYSEEYMTCHNINVVWLLVRGVFLYFKFHGLIEKRNSAIVSVINISHAEGCGRDGRLQLSLALIMVANKLRDFPVGPAEH